MIDYRKGNLFAAGAEALVNTVNCVGVMGRGVALQFKKAFPENFKAYAAACKRGEVVPGRIFVFATGSLTPPRFILNFPTKRHWRAKSRMEDIEAGLEDLVRRIQALKIRSIALPPLGSGLGGLPWEEVRQKIEEALVGLEDVQVIVYEPGYTPKTVPARSKRPVKMTPGRAALVMLMERYLRGALDPFISLLEVHKLMYFLQEAGEPLRLRFNKGPYGPYAENLRHVLHEVEGAFLRGYADGGEAPGRPLELLPGAQEKADEVLSGRPETRERLSRVSELVQGFETPSGLELLSTVHWLVQKEGILVEDILVEKVHAWAKRKRQFSPRQIRLARRVLVERRWLPPGRGSSQKDRSA